MDEDEPAETLGLDLCQRTDMLRSATRRNHGEPHRDGGRSGPAQHALFRICRAGGGTCLDHEFSTEDSGVSTPPPDASRAMTPAAATCCPRTSSSRCSEDHAGTVWVSSDKGLFAFNPQTKAIRRFTIFDGLLNNDFKNCGLRSADGDLYFGSRSGFIRFNPEKFDRESGDPRWSSPNSASATNWSSPPDDGVRPSSATWTAPDPSTSPRGKIRSDSDSPSSTRRCRNSTP